jgi:hypothetical protein
MQAYFVDVLYWTYCEAHHDFQHNKIDMTANKEEQKVSFVIKFWRSPILDGSNFR